MHLDVVPDPDSARLRLSQPKLLVDATAHWAQPILPKFVLTLWQLRAVVPPYSAPAAHWPLEGQLYRMHPSRL